MYMLLLTKRGKRTIFAYITGLVTAVAPIDRPKSVHNHCKKSLHMYVATLTNMYYLSFSGVCQTTASDLFPFRHI